MTNKLNNYKLYNSYSIQNQTKTFQLKCLLDMEWEKEIILTIDGNCNKIQAEKIFAIFYPNCRMINDVEVNEI